MYDIISICKGGGYMYCKTEPVHPKANSNGLYPLHRVVAENKIGRPLEKGEHVHHIDGVKSNNSPENLEVLTDSEHAKMHIKQVDLLESNCQYCGKPIKFKPAEMRLRSGRNKNNYVYCSRSCAAKFQHNACEKKDEKLVLNCQYCGKPVEMYASTIRSRFKRNKNNYVYCSKICSGKYHRNKTK